MTDYSYTKQVYQGVPFKYVVRKKGKYDVWGFTTDDTAVIVSGFTSYSGLNLSAEQLSGSLMTVKINAGELPDKSYCVNTCGCLASAGQNYNVNVSGYNNFTKVGTPNVDEYTGIASNFSTSNYLSESLASIGSVWDIYVKFTTPSSTITGGQQMLMIGSQNSETNVYAKLFITQDGTVCYAAIGDNSGNFVLDAATARFSINNNTTYYVKLGCDGSKCYLYYSTSGFDSLTLVDEAVGAVTVLSESLYMGYSTYTSKGAFGGLLDLSQTYITSNGSTAWSPLGTISTTAVGLLPSGVTDDGSAQTWNLFYNDGTFLIDKTSTMNGYSWCGTINIPAHTI